MLWLVGQPGRLRLALGWCCRVFHPVVYPDVRCAYFKDSADHGVRQGAKLENCTESYKGLLLTGLGLCFPYVRTVFSGKLGGNVLFGDMWWCAHISKWPAFGLPWACPGRASGAANNSFPLFCFFC